MILAMTKPTAQRTSSRIGIVKMSCCLLLMLVSGEGFAPTPTISNCCQRQAGIITISVQPNTRHTTTLSLSSTSPSFGNGEKHGAAATFTDNVNPNDDHSLTPPNTILVPSIERSSTSTTATATTKVQRRYQSFPWEYNGRTFDINYRVEGPVQGPPILLIHGFGANLNHYRHQFPVLVEADYRVYAIDLLGFGASPKPGNVQYSMELYVQLAADFMQSMSKRTKSRPFQRRKKQQPPPTASWIVAGNSIGGLISLGVAEKLPDMVRGVILFNCSGGMTGFRYSDVPVWARPILWFFQKILLGPRVGSSFFSKFKTRGNVESILKKQGVYRDQTNVDDELLEILLRPAEDDGAETVFLKTFAGDPGPTPEEILPHVKCPVLAVWGGDDPWTPVDGGMHPGTKFHEYCDDFELHTIPHCGHCPHDEAPDAVNALILPWMKNLDSHRETLR